MKFNKSCILLIAIAIFLLISIGSVCASDNITDSDDTLADDGTDVVLSDTDDNVPDDTNTEKINTTTETDNSTYKFGYDSDKKFEVTVKDNKSTHINVNKTDLSVMEGNKTINFDYNNSIITVKDLLSVGEHNLTVNYLGNANYTNSFTNITLRIFGNNTIETETSVVCNGKDIIIPVKVYDGVDYIELITTNFNLTLVYINETGNISNVNITDFTVENGKIIFESPVNKLIAASLTIDYTNATEPKTVAVKVSTEVKAETDKDKFKSEETKNISIKILDGQGNLLNISENDLKVFENGEEITSKYANSNLTVELGVGVHNLTIVYDGNETYNASSCNIIVKVFENNTITTPTSVESDGKNVEIPVIISNGIENLTDNEFTLNLTYTNKTGNITSVIINSENCIYENGILKFNVEAYDWIKASVNINYVNSTGSKNVIIYLTSSVKATPAKDKYRYNETNNITITVNGNNGETLTITENDLQVLDNGETINFHYNETTKILTVNLNEGVHNLTIIYNGNDTFNSSRTYVESRVFGDLKLEPASSVVLNEDKTVTIFLNLNDGADLVEVNKTKLNITFFWTINGETKNIQVTEYDLTNQNVTFKVDEFESAYAYIKYDTLNATTQIKVNTTVNSSDITYGETQVKNITVNVVGDNGYKINITKDNIQVLNNGKALTIEVNNSVITIKDALKFGVYNLTIKYLGTNTFLASEKNITLTVYGINATSPVNVNSTKKGEVKIQIIGNETITINPDDLILNVTYKNGNDTIEIKVTNKEIKNGTLIFTLENGNFTTATLNIKYDQTEANVTLNRIYNAEIIALNTVNEFKTGNFTFLLRDIDDGSNLTGKTIKLTTVGNIRAGFSATTDANGIATFRTINLYEFNNNGENGAISLSQIELDVGNHTVDIENDNSNVIASKLTTNLTITQGHFNIVVNPYKEYYGTDKPVTVTVTNSIGEAVPGVIVKLTIDKLSGDYYLYTNTSGVGRISLYNTESKSGLVGGDYVFTVSNNDTVNIAKTTAKGTVTVMKIPTVITGKDVTIQYNTGTTYTITVKQNGKALSGMYVLVRLYSTSKKYNDYLFQTNNKGQIAFSASLDVGKHKIIINSADNRYDAKQVTKTITVKKASAKITAKKLTTYYKSGKYLTVKLTNTKNKKPIFNAKISIAGNTIRTDMNGKARLSLGNLKPGTYKVLVKGADSKNYQAKKVTVSIVIKKAPAKFIAKKVTAKKGAKKYFKVTVKNKKTKKVITGVKIKVKVYTGKKAKTYTLKTNSKGVAKLAVTKLKAGTHKVVITSANKYVTANQKKSTIKIKK